MSAHPPPVPPEQRPRQGADPETPRGETTRHPEHESRNRDPREQQGQSGNTRQNTTNQGYQQDR